MVPVLGAEGLASQASGQSTKKKRKIRHPRTARACEFCRRRKVRCSGTQPCEYCAREEAVCNYDNNSRGAVSQVERDTSDIPGSTANDLEPPFNNPPPSHDIPLKTPFQDVLDTSNGTTARSSRRTSLEPPQNFVGDHHIPPTAGVSFLYHAWNRGQDVNIEEYGGSDEPVPLTSYGDLPQSKLPISDSTSSLPTAESAHNLLERYFRFATPTYRFLHRPTLKDWTDKLLKGSRLSVPKSACVLLACAQALLYTKAGDRYAGGGDDELHTSIVYYHRAKTMLGHEPGPASLESVQARLAMCLYLLSTFRFNECRFCFSFATEISTSLGLHRKISTSAKTSLVESESRKRTFWCAYVLDGYLSVMLGRPRLIRDEDVDQSFPRNLDDEDILSSEPPEDLPLHGNLEAFIWHAKLAKLMGRNNELLYPLQPLSEEDALVRTNEMIEALEIWRNGLPDFLKPREKTLAGQRTFERQNTVLKLASAHLQILMTRRCLVADFNRLGRSVSMESKNSRALRPVQVCIAGISIIIGAAYDLVRNGSFHQAFWFTQYTALVAISTLYVFLIQGARNALPAPIESFLDIEISFERAKKCQEHLAAIAPDGSQAKRHHKLLDHLKARAEKELLRMKGKHLPGPSVVSAIPGAQPSSLPTPLADEVSSQFSKVTDFSITARDNAIDTSAQTTADNIHASFAPQPPATLTSQTYNSLYLDTSVSDGQSFVDFHFTPSEDDFAFKNMVGFGWESLDTIGFPVNFGMYSKEV